MSKKNFIIASNSKLNSRNKENKNIEPFSSNTLYSPMNKDKLKSQMKEMIRKSMSQEKSSSNNIASEYKSFFKPKNTIEIHNFKITEFDKLIPVTERCIEKQNTLLQALTEENSDTKKLIEYIKSQIEKEKKIYEDLEIEDKKSRIEEINKIDQGKKILEKNMMKIHSVKEECLNLGAELADKEYTLSNLSHKSEEMKNRIDYNNLEMDDKVKLKSFKQNELMNKKKLYEENATRIVDVNRINTEYIDYLRMIHNDLQESKGNIRVFCRVRPILSKEMKEEVNPQIGNNLSSNMLPQQYIEYPNYNTIILNGPTTKSNVGKNKEVFNREIYKFDRVFKPEDSQEEVFKEISQLVQSALDGYKVCIFAYGQTGSGKTYTMEGEEDDKRGIISRSIEQIFGFKSTLEGMGWSFAVEASCFEIYMDQVKDLLMTNSGTNNVIPPNKPEKFTVVEVKKVDDLQTILATASAKRAVAETQCNEKSSRSHCIFQLKITGKNVQSKQERHGALNLVDLAGSERISTSKVEGERLKETISINKSLTCLKSVITALVNTNAKTNSHIPYRNSILTFLLQNYLGGDSKTLMFVNISPLINNFSESSCSLKFASDVNSCYNKSFEDKFGDKTDK